MSKIHIQNYETPTREEVKKHNVNFGWWDHFAADRLPSSALLWQSPHISSSRNCIDMFFTLLIFFFTWHKRTLSNAVTYRRDAVWMHCEQVVTSVNKNILYQNSKAAAATMSHAVQQQRFCQTARIDVVHTAEEKINTEMMRSDENHSIMRSDAFTALA